MTFAFPFVINDGDRLHKWDKFFHVNLFFALFVEQLVLFVKQMFICNAISWTWLHVSYLSKKNFCFFFLVFVLPFCLRFSRSLIICLFVLAFADPVHFRPRVCSLPENSRAPYNPRSRDDIYRLRNFSITSKGVVNRGDAIISRHSRSNTSINSTLTA